MNTKRSRMAIQRGPAIVFIALLLVTVTSLAGGGYTLPWWGTDNRGGASRGGGYTLSGTLGQPDAGQMTGGGFTLRGGFWHGEVPNGFDLYLPLVTR